MIRKIISVKQAAFCALVLAAQFTHAIDVSLDGSFPLSQNDDVVYETQGQTTVVNSSDPVLCHKTNPTSGGSSVEVIDPNGEGKIMPLTTAINYNLTSGVVAVNVNSEDGVCVTNSGSSFGDLIFSNGFIPGDFRYEGIGLQTVRDESLDYVIVVENLDSGLLSFDLVEYVAASPASGAAYFDSVDNWECPNHGNNGIDCNQDNTANILLNASIPSGQSLQIDVSRTVSATSVLGQKLDILTAMFIKNSQNEIIDVKVIKAAPMVVDNDAPVIDWNGSTDVNFIEDQQQAVTLTFDITDSTGNDFDVNYLSTAIGGVNDKVEISGIVVNEINSELTRVSFDVLPKPNYFTSLTNTEQIFVQIEDNFGSDSNLLTLPVTIAPINDAPSFDIACMNFTLNPTPVGGQLDVTCNDQVPSLSSWSYSDFITQISAGGVNNSTESSQNVAFEILPVSGIINQGSAIITADPGTFLLNDLILNINNGVSGEGRFRVRAFDNGTPNGQVNTCPAVAVTDHCNTSEYSAEVVFNLLPPTYYVSGVINGLPASDSIGMLLKDATGNNLGLVQNYSGTSPNGSAEVKFTYQSALLDGQIFNILISDDFASVECSVTNGQNGTINGANIDDVVIDCAPPSP